MNTRVLIGAVLLGCLTVGAVCATETEAAVKGKPALVVMDIQNIWLPYMDDDGKDVALRMANAAIHIFQEQGLPIIYVYHTDPERGPATDSTDFAFPESIIIAEDAVKVVKNHPSAFRETDLARILEDQGCDTVFLVGLSATGCVLATYYDAIGLDLHPFMVKHALLSHKAELTRAVEEITGAVGYQALEYMITNAPR